MLNIVLGLLAVIQLAGMAWAWRTLRKEGELSSDGGPFLWRAFLVVCWPVTWALGIVGAVQ